MLSEERISCNVLRAAQELAMSVHFPSLWHQRSCASVQGSVQSGSWGTMYSGVKN